jgi:hypothetical protein
LLSAKQARGAACTAHKCLTVGHDDIAQGRRKVVAVLPPGDLALSACIILASSMPGVDPFVQRNATVQLAHDLKYFQPGSIMAMMVLINSGSAGGDAAKDSN